MDPLPRRPRERFRRPVDIAVVTSRQGGDDRTLDGVGDLLHTAQVALRGRGEAGFDHVHAERIELACQSKLCFR